MIREANEGDLQGLLGLYLHLHEQSVPEATPELLRTWQSILRDENHHVIVYEQDGKIVSSCVCVVIPNLTRQARPYALVENVVTHPDYRKRGMANDCLNRAKEIAKNTNCYKIMLLTGAKDQETLRFYKNAGFNGDEKTAFLIRL